MQNVLKAPQYIISNNYIELWKSVNINIFIYNENNIYLIQSAFY